MSQIIRVLLVEDDPNDVSVVRAILETRGQEFRLEVASNGNDALALMQRSLPDVVLLDHNLPGMNGLAILEQIRRNQWQVRVAILTGIGDELVAAEAIKQGADDYVIKDDKIVMTLVPLLKRLQRADGEASKNSESFVPSQIHLLHVEDSPSDAGALNSYFAKYSPHIHVSLAASSAMAMELLKSGRPVDCILVDLRLPGVDGLRLMSQIRTLGYEVPFVVITGVGGEESAVIAMKQGAYDYIPKRDNYIAKVPYAVEVAVLKFRNDLMNRKLQRELIDLNASLEQKVRERTAALSEEVNLRRRSEDQVRRLNRVYALLSNINQAIVRIHDVNQLLNTACRIAVEEGRFQTAWIRIADIDTKKIDVSHYGGIGGELFDDLARRMDFSEPVANRIAGIMRSGKHFVSNDISAEDKGSEVWIQKCLALGLKSIAVFPLVVLGKTVGAFFICSNEIHFFDDREIGLLDEMARDISFALEFIQKDKARQRAEDALRESELRFRSVWEKGTDGMRITDEQGTVLLANDAYCTMMEKQRSEIEGKPMSIVYEIAAQQKTQRSLQERFRLRTVPASLERDVVLWNGKRMSFELSNSFLEIPHQPTLLLSVLRDITERKRAEEALEESENRYRQFFEDDLTGDYISTPDGKVLSCNPAFARIFGFASTEDALTSNASMLFAEPSGREQFLNLLREKKRLDYHQAEYLRHDGSPVYCIENAIGAFDSEGNLVQIRGYVLDESQRKLLERQLAQAQKLESLGTLASGIAHDFNNILGIILGYASLLAHGEPDQEKLKSNVDAVLKATRRGAALVKQLLTFARKTDVQLQPVRLNDVLDELSKLLSETVPKTIEITLNLRKDLPNITGDPTQIHQVLLNLSVNARDAMPNGGRLTLSTHLQRGDAIRNKFPNAAAREYAMLTVADTGGGMDQKTRSRIFEPFFTTKEVGKGTGLGLSVVFGIVESHKGFIDLESEPGMGTTFYLYFPVLQPEEIEQTRAETEKEIPGGTETLLVVEDEGALRELLKTALQTAGYVVLTAVDGEEAIELFSHHHDDIKLILSDAGLPKLSGYDIFRKMKSRDPNLKFVLASGYVEPRLKSEIFKEGVKDFVQKPYGIYELLRSVRTILDQE